MQVDLFKYLDDLEIVREYFLNAEPLRIDVLIIKKDPDIDITDADFARDFKDHNIVELKSPSHNLDVSGFFKTIGYACVYQAMARVSYKDITITVICAGYPRAVINELRNELGYSVIEKYPGIYTVGGAPFPIQIVMERTEMSAGDAFQRIAEERGWDG